MNRTIIKYIIIALAIVAASILYYKTVEAIANDRIHDREIWLEVEILKQGYDRMYLESTDASYEKNEEMFME